MKNSILLLSFIVKVTVAWSINMPIVDEALLIACQAAGHALYYNCVVKPSLKPDDLATCGTLKITYLTCLAHLNNPYPLMPSSDPDPYVHNPFTPCHFETGHTILYDICPNIP